VRRPCRRIGRATFAPSPKILCELLQHRENTPLLGQGCPTHALSSADRTHRVACPGRRSASPIRPTLSFRHTQPSGGSERRADYTYSCACILRCPIPSCARSPYSLFSYPPILGRAIVAIGPILTTGVLPIPVNAPPRLGSGQKTD